MEASSLLGISIWGIAKFFAIFALILYIVFALVVVRQIRLMTDTLEVGFESPIKLLGYLHLGVAILVLVISLLIL